MFKLTIENDSNNTYDLMFRTLRTSIANQWVNQIKKNYPLYETDRFTNWPNSIKRDSYYESNLLRHIRIINNYDPLIVESVPEIITQEYFNFLHKHFEDLRGQLDHSTTWYNNAPDIVKNSVDRLNILIHEYENYLDEQKHSWKNPTIVGTFKDRPCYKLDDDDYQHFTHAWKFGTVYINYCEVGKPLLDVFKDNDMHVGNDAVRPQKLWSADFMVKLGPSIPEEYSVSREEMFWKWFNKQDLDIDPKYVALGMIPVAVLDKNIDVRTLAGFNRIESVCIE